MVCVFVLTGVFHTCRCNNVLYIRGVEEEEEDGEMREWRWWRRPPACCCCRLSECDWTSLVELMSVCVFTMWNGWTLGQFFPSISTSFFFFYCMWDQFYVVTLWYRHNKWLYPFLKPGCGLLIYVWQKHRLHLSLSLCTLNSASVSPGQIFALFPN